MQLPVSSTMEWLRVGDEDAHLVRGGRPVADLVAGERNGPGVQEPWPVAGDAGVRHGDGVEEEVHVAAGERRRVAEHLVVDDVATVGDRDPE